MRKLFTSVICILSMMFMSTCFANVTFDLDPYGLETEPNRLRINGTFKNHSKDKVQIDQLTATIKVSLKGKVIGEHNLTWKWKPNQLVLNGNESKRHTLWFSHNNKNYNKKDVSINMVRNIKTTLINAAPKSQPAPKPQVYNYIQYSGDDRNWPLILGRNDEAFYLQKNSVKCELYNPPYYILTGYCVGHKYYTADKYNTMGHIDWKIYYDTDEKCMYVFNRGYGDEEWKELSPDNLDYNGYGGEAMFYIMYGQKFWNKMSQDFYNRLN